MNTSNNLNTSELFASVLGCSTLEAFESENKEEKPKEEIEEKPVPVPEEKQPTVEQTNKKQHVNTTKLSDYSCSVDQNVQKTTYDFRIIILGNIAVGKTCIISRFVHNKYNKDYKCSIGVEFCAKTLNISQSSIANLKIWDTCGDEKYRAITRQYYKDAQGILLVYDITNKKSFEGLNDWYNDIKEKCIKNAQIILVGNKSDLAEDKVVTNEDIKGFLKDKKNIDSIEVSAKTGRNITLLFEKLTNQLIMTEKERLKDNDENNKSANMKLSVSSSFSKKKRMNLNVKSKKEEESKTGCC